MSLDYNKILNFTRKTARKAGEIIASEREKQDFSQDYKDGIELVTSADLASDKYITEQISAEYPEHLILSEESSRRIKDEQILNNAVWIVDPIDGTVNYALGHNQVGISIALAVDGIVMFGLVHSPFQNETFYAIKNQGAYLNGEKINVRKDIPLKNAVIGTGFAYKVEEREEQLKQVAAVLRNCGNIRRSGSAALDLCWVACGRLSGYYENVKSWDMAAGTLIAKEAGATAGNLEENYNKISDLEGRGLVAASPDIYEDLFKLLKNAK